MSFIALFNVLVGGVVCMSVLCYMSFGAGVCALVSVLGVFCEIETLVVDVRVCSLIMSTSFDINWMTSSLIIYA